MLVLITYDVSVTTAEGRRRLRQIAKACLDCGIRVQKSVFECDVEPAQFTQLKEKLISIYNDEEDSIRFYFLGKRGREKVEHYGAKPADDPLNDTLIV